MNMEIRVALFPSFQLGLKRLIDLAGAVLGILLFGPLFLLILILLQIETPGKAFYLQERVGLGGKRFKMVKFRTMRETSGGELERILLDDGESRLQYEKYQKLFSDPRTTRFGRFLRRSSLDELPQLWNVLIGEMSLVGPRPFLPEQLDLYGRAYIYYQKVHPGMTGLWQVAGRNRLTFEERARLDVEYIQNWSLQMDLAILARTPRALLISEGAY